MVLILRLTASGRRARSSPVRCGISMALRWTCVVWTIAPPVWALALGANPGRAHRLLCTRVRGSTRGGTAPVCPPDRHCGVYMCRPFRCAHRPRRRYHLGAFCPCASCVRCHRTPRARRRIRRNRPRWRGDGCAQLFQRGLTWL